MKRKPTGLGVSTKNKSYLFLYNQAVKEDALAYYANDGKIECRCCGCPYVEYLEFDHIDGMGQTKRKETGNKLAYELKKQGYPDGIQILCVACNRSKNKGKECTYHKYKEKRIWPNTFEFSHIHQPIDQRSYHECDCGKFLRV